MNLNENDWYFILFLLVLIALVGLNEAGYGAIVFVPLMLLEVWLIYNAFRNKRSSI